MDFALDPLSELHSTYNNTLSPLPHPTLRSAAAIAIAVTVAITAAATSIHRYQD